MEHLHHTRLSLAWSLLIFLVCWISAYEAALGLTLLTELAPWQVLLDGLLSSLLLIDLATLGRKRLPWAVAVPLALPWSGLALGMGGGGLGPLVLLARLLQMARLLHLVGLWQRSFVFNKALKLGPTLLLALLSIHWVACGWMAIYPFDPQGGDDLFTFYNKAVYWAVTTLTTIGYGDITPQSNGGRLFTMVIMILGVGVYGVVIGNVSNRLITANRHKENNQQKMEDLGLFLKHYRVPVQLQRQVIHFYHHLLHKNLSDNDDSIIQDLPHSLQQELRVYMSMKFIGQVPIFQKSSLATLKMIALHLEQQYYSPCDAIIRRGEVGQEMFMIGHGQVEVLSEEGAPLATLGEGQCFGEVALLEETTRSHDVRAKGYCDIYILKKETFLVIIKKFPQLKRDFEQLVRKRMGAPDGGQKAS